MKSFNRFFAIAALAASLFALAGCPDIDHDKPSGSTSSGDVSHLYVVLKADNALTALTTTRAARTLSVQSNSTQAAPNPAAAATGCPGLGNVISVQNDSYTIMSCTGVLMTVGIAPTANDTSALFGPTGAYQVWWDQPNCQGNAFTRAAPGISGAGLVNGYAFWMDPTFSGAHDSTTYWMVAPNTTPTDGVTVVSFFDGNSCQSTSAVLDGLYAVVPADENVTNWPNALVQGPVLITHL